jgi:predicted metal-binding membrane protein
MRAMIGSARPARLRGRPNNTQSILAGLILGAWLALGAWTASPYAHYLDHAAQPAGVTPSLASLALFALGWTLMITAMMLPTATSLLRGFGRVVHGRQEQGILISFLVAGFVVTWLGVGFAFRVADSRLHVAVAAFDWLEDRPGLIAGGVLVAAGLYQFTGWKHRCLTACRTPSSFIYRHWRGNRSTADAFRIGLTYGLSCVGCCWSLMLVLFALGMSSVFWMLGFATLMALEKSTTLGVRLVRPVGSILVAVGVVVAIGAA